MDKQEELKFSSVLQDGDSIDARLQNVEHPLVKQIITQVMAEYSDDIGLGSGFGEAGN